MRFFKYFKNMEMKEREIHFRKEGQRWNTGQLD